MNGETKKYQEFIKRYLTEQGVPLSPWKDVQPLYLRFRGRCLKEKPANYQQFLNLCTFESKRHCKYDDKGALKEGYEVGWSKDKGSEDVFETGSRNGISKIRKGYKLNYKASPKKEDFEFAMEWRDAYRDWSYLKAELADYEAVKTAISRFEVGKCTNDLGESVSDLLKYPYLIKYALKCLSSTFPKECFPEVLSDYREELQDLLDKQKESYNKEGPANFKFYM